MQIVTFLVVFLMLFVNGLTVALAQNKVIVVPVGDDDLMTIPIKSEPEEPAEPSPYLEDAIDKPIIWNKGWDKNIGHKTKIDPTVQIELVDLRQVLGYPGIIYPANEIRHWGEQTYYTGSSNPIYAKAVLLVDKGDAVEGGAFEWSLNKQGFMSFKNILKTGSSTRWVLEWTDPRPGEKVWYFIMSDDEKYSSNPISFIWP